MAKNRIVEKSTRRLLITVATLMFMWLLLRYIKYYFFASYETASRYLWYLYYIPQCLVPPLAWIAAMGLTRKSSRSVCKCLYLVLVPAIVLILLILTNDLHQTAFVFKENFANFETDYKHGAVYNITTAWLALGMIAAVGTLFLKCSISACKKKVWIPITVFAVCAAVSDETVRRWKNGERDILLSQLVKLADYFQCSLDFLAGRSETVLDYQVREMPPFYDSLRAVMKEKGVTRYRLVKDLPIYDGYFTNWKKGKSPNILTLIMLANYLDVTIDYMVGRER